MTSISHPHPITHPTTHPTQQPTAEHSLFQTVPFPQLSTCEMFARPPTQPGSSMRIDHRADLTRGGGREGGRKKGKKKGKEGSE